MTETSNQPRPLPVRAIQYVIRQPEMITIVLLIGAFIVGAMLSPYFLNIPNLFESTSLYMETGLMALAMTFVIISGNIDLSVASGLALIAVSCAMLHDRMHVPMAVVIALGPLMGGVLGLFNGWLIAKLRLPSLTVTLGTLALFRGLAQVMAGDQSVQGLPDWFTGIDLWKIGDLVPVPLMIFIPTAIIAGIVLHKTVFGRCVYVIGTNEQAARFSGIRTDRVKISVFMISGVMMGMAAMIMLSRLTAARYDMARGDELAVITAVVLGGADIFGGRGTILGTVIALFLLGIIRQGMGLAMIRIENQLAVNGSLLILAVILTNLSVKFSQRTRAKTGETRAA